MEKILNLIKKATPSYIFEFFQPIYHYLMALSAAVFYGFPSRKMIVIGVIGTKGKTTTCNLIAQILNFSGHKTGMATTVNFRIGNKEWKNETKQTMLGRFKLQKLLRQMVDEECEYAVVETSSEGILQYRHRFIDYDVAVFTNLSPEHIERHGGFENYRNAKVKLFEKVVRKKNGIGIYNLDDENVGYFLKPDIKNKYGYGIKFLTSHAYRQAGNFQFPKKLKISNISLFPDKTEFEFNNENFRMSLIGEFNVYNAAAAICAALSQGISIAKIKTALIKARAPFGRMEIIKSKDFNIIVDYAHEPASLEAVYKTIKNSGLMNKNSKMICLLGAQGGGRDKWKRPEMGKIADQYCDKIILTNEDPYDENPSQILSDIKSGIKKSENLYEIVDRKEAIKKALSLAKSGDAVVLTGKGGESSMCVENNKKIPWNESEIVKVLLNK
ncbi:UDP-N-acetylmuramyl-tripeptide synthetase [Candidatus Wolfebacteria bacterium]|nr:UDP-N-acetylmuramyl-tripeptide synthetase [Candidatus Wolfebacteria bacterium]